jgi:hypothetical protein
VRIKVEDERSAMALLVGLLILALLCIPLVISIRRSNELFCVTVLRGRATFRRGRVPQGLLDDINDVVRQPPVRRASIRVVQQGGQPHAQISGRLSAGQRQRLRNVVGTYSVAKIKGGNRPARTGRPKRRRGPRR